MVIEEACAEFLVYCGSEHQLSPNSLAAYKQDLKECCLYFGERQIGDISGEDLVAYSRHLATTRGSAPSTVKRRLACLRAMFVRLVRRAVICATPFASVSLQIRIPTRLPRCLGAEEVRALLGAATSSCTTTRLSVLLLLATGARIGELTSVRLEDVNLSQSSVRILGKGNRERQVFIPNDAIAGLTRDYVADKHQDGLPTDRLLVNGRGRPASSACLRARIKDLAVAAGIARRVTPHMLRHTAATALMEAGVDIRLIQRLLGHQSIVTTQIYTHVSNSALKAAVTKANICREDLTDGTNAA